MHKILVSQIGARHRYLIPQILNKSKLLSNFYTDSCKLSPLGKLAQFINLLGIKNTSITRLINRNPQIETSKVFTTDALFIKSTFRLNNNPFQKINTIYQGLSSSFIKKGVKNCDIIYNMYFENIEFLKYAKREGKTIVVDIYENPTAFYNLINEINNIAEYSRYKSIKDQYSAENKVRDLYMNELLAVADYYTIPSLFVLNSLTIYSNFNQNKVHLLPYPSSITRSQYNYRPIKHKIIWVGNDPVRKGLIYCAKAATILKEKYPDLTFEVIGITDKDLIKNPTFKDLRFIGTLNKKQLIEQYETAEAYVFPTLYEGLAGTIIEAACCGCPIITTESSGVDKNNFPALFIPTHNINAIVDSVDKIFQSTLLRDQLSKEVFQFANYEYSPSTYEKRLLKFFETI